MKNLELKTKFRELTFRNGIFDPRAVRQMKAEIDAAIIEGYPTFKDKVCALALELDERIKCPCGNITALISTTKGYRPFCSQKCAAGSALTVERRKATCRSVFGVENAAAAESVKAKIKDTCVSRYGVQSIGASKDVQTKIRQTVLSKYGVANVMNVAEVTDKIKKAYAGKSDQQKHSIKNKRQKTVLSKFGYEQILQVPNIRQTIAETNLSKYGHTVSVHGDLREKTRRTRRETYVNKYLKTRLEECIDAGIIPMGWNINDYLDSTVAYKFLHKKCGSVFLGKFKNSTIPRCSECQKNGSLIEHKLFGDIQKHFPEAIQHDRSKLKPREIDILVGDVGIEINGAYWHRDALGKPILDKTKAFDGTLIHLWDFELENKYDICLSLVLSKLGKFERRVYARSCEIREVGYAEAKRFFDNNHLRGNAKFSLCYGLYIDDELIQAISISKSRYSKAADLELIRTASILNTQVVGGLSRLFAALTKRFPGKILLTYADRRYSKPTAYVKWFSFSHITPPNYFWFKGDSFLSRYQTQKHKLHKLFKDIRHDDTERSILIRNGYFKVSDCGNLVLKRTL